MGLTSLKKLLQHASANRYAVGAFNVINLDFLEAIIAAAEVKRSPVILNIAEVHFKYVTLENICPAVRAICGRSDIPVCLNLDHGETLEAVDRAVANGFTSVMFDGSKLSYEENLLRSAEVVRRCRPKGISVEAELGAVGGGEDGALVGTPDPRFFTDPGQAGEFVRRTGVDALAVAIGNAHGRYKGEPRLDFQRLERIRAAAGIPLVLHGGSGISDVDFRKAVSLGIAKINFYTGMSQAALEATLAALKATGSSYNDYPEMLRSVRTAVSGVVGRQMDVFGSTGRCRKDHDRCPDCGTCGEKGRTGTGDYSRTAGLTEAERVLVEEVTRRVLNNLGGGA